MFSFTRDNIDNSETIYKFVRLVDCISILESYDATFIGSVVYEYLWRCSAACLPWRKYSSLKRIVEENDVIIEDINVYFQASTSALEVADGFGRFSKRVDCSLDDDVLTVKFGSSFEADMSVRITLTKDDTISDWDSLESVLGLYRKTFFVWKQREHIRIGLQDLFDIKFEEFSDLHMHGLVNQIGAMVIKNSSAVLVSSDAFPSGDQLTKSLEKGYTAIWSNKGIKFKMPFQETGEKCSICLDRSNSCVDFFGFQGVVTLPCKHEYHLTCICKWTFKKNTTCPLCRFTYLCSPFSIFKS